MTTATNSNVTWILTHTIPKINSKLNHINSGGCGVFAYELHKALKVRGIKSSVVLVGGHGYNKFCVRSFIEKHRGTGINSAYQKAFK